MLFRGGILAGLIHSDKMQCAYLACPILCSVMSLTGEALRPRATAGAGLSGQVSAVGGGNPDLFNV